MVGFSELRFESPALIETFCVGDKCLDDCLTEVSEQETKELDFEFGFEHTHKGVEWLEINFSEHETIEEGSEISCIWIGTWTVDVEKGFDESDLSGK